MPELSPKRKPTPIKPAPGPLAVKPFYKLGELAGAAGVSLDVMRRRLRACGFPPPGRRVPEVIYLADLRSKAPSLFDSLTRASLSQAEAEVVARRLASGG